MKPNSVSHARIDIFCDNQEVKNKAPRAPQQRKLGVFYVCERWTHIAFLILRNCFKNHYKIIHYPLSTRG